jgi:hypothetical protein
MCSVLGTSTRTIVSRLVLFASILIFNFFREPEMLSTRIFLYKVLLYSTAVQCAGPSCYVAAPVKLAPKINFY